MHLIKATLAAFACLLATQAASAQDSWSANYYPVDRGGVEYALSRWKYTDPGVLPNNTQFFMNIWHPFNAGGTRTVPGTNHRYPMGVGVSFSSFSNRAWKMNYDINGELPSNNPAYFTDPKKQFKFVKAYPHIQWKPPYVLGAWMSGERELQAYWDLEATSSAWAANEFNAMIEVRMARFEANGSIRPDSEYIIQIELLNRGFGTPSSNRVFLGGYTWAKGQFITVATDTSTKGVPVYKFTWINAPISQNFRKVYELDLFAIVNHVSQNPGFFSDPFWNRGNVWCRILEVNGGIELKNGWNSSTQTHKYWAGSWTK